MRQALGAAVFSGMLGVTFFGIFLTPVFFSVIMKFFGRKPVAKLVAPVVIALDGRATASPASSHRFAQ